MLLFEIIPSGVKCYELFEQLFLDVPLAAAYPSGLDFRTTPPCLPRCNRMPTGCHFGF